MTARRRQRPTSEVHPSIESDLAALRAVLESGRFGSEDATVALESELAARLGAQRAVTTSSGSASIELTLRALGIGVGDNVIVPAFTCRAVADSVRASGARPVFADVVWPPGPITASTVERVVNRRTRAIIVVDLYGALSSVEDVAAVAERNGATLIVDQAQSFGARQVLGDGNLVTIASFHPSKVLAAGEGGVVATDNVELAERVRYLRSPGALQVRLGRPVEAGTGRSMRMSDLDAALARSRLMLVESVLAERSMVAARLHRALTDAGLPVSFPETAGHAFSTFPLLVDTEVDRDSVVGHLRRSGIAASPGYRPLHRPRSQGDQCPMATRLGAGLVCLPTHRGVAGAEEPSDDSKVVEALREVIGG